MLIPSNKIKVYPTSRRNDKIDSTAKLNTEENIVGLTNRLTNGKSYILNGLNVVEFEDNGTTKLKITAGECVISGYKFSLKEQVIDKNYNGSYEQVFFQIDIIDNGDFNELVNEQRIENTKYLTLDDNTNLFYGININTLNLSQTINILLLSEKINNE